MNIIKFKPELMDKIRNGDKKATTRLGIKDKYSLGKVVFSNCENPNDRINSTHKIVEIRSLEVRGLTLEMAISEGYKGRGGLIRALESIYGELDALGELTYIRWE